MDPMLPQSEHPTERSLARYAASEMGPALKKKVYAHLEGCAECRTRVVQLRHLARRFRDFERIAIATAASLS